MVAEGEQVRLDQGAVVDVPDLAALMECCGDGGRGAGLDAEPEGPEVAGRGGLMRPTLDEIFAEEDEFGLLDVKPAAAAGIATRQPKGAESKANGGMHAATGL
ncbi:hypothetical protein D3C72_536460 [compost metagenome]